MIKLITGFRYFIIIIGYLLLGIITFPNLNLKIMVELFTRFGIGFFGLWLYVLFTVWSSGNLKDFSLKKHWYENKNRWLVAMTLIFSISVLVEIIPDGGTLIKEITGLDIEGTLTSFLSLGYFFGSSTKKMVNKNILK